MFPRIPRDTSRTLLSYSEANVRDENGTLLAHGTSTLMALPGKGIDLKAEKFL